MSPGSREVWDWRRQEKRPSRRVSGEEMGRGGRERRRGAAGEVRVREIRVWISVFRSSQRRAFCLILCFGSL